MRLSVRTLKLLSLTFLILPVFVFFMFWVKLFIALPVIVLLLFSIYKYNKSLFDEEEIDFSKAQFFILLGLVVLWVSMSGIGGFGIKLHDQFKVYSLSKDIMENSWPVLYIHEGKEYILSSYLGYFISAPVLVGWLSYDMVNGFLFFYGVLGVFLGLVWLAIISGNRTAFVFVVFVLAGGFDIAGYLYQNGVSELLKGNWPQFYWWNSLKNEEFLLYHGNTNLLFWAAPHAIPCWVASGLFFYDLIKKQDLTRSPLYLFPLVFWTPFILVGLFPYFCFLLLKKGLKDYLRIENFTIIPAFLLLIWFVTSVEVTEFDKGFLLWPVLSKMSLIESFFRYAWFVFFEVVVWLIFIYFSFKNADFLSKNKQWFWVMAMVLLVIPLYRFGKYNDWVQRVSMPSLYLLWAFLLASLAQIKRIGHRLIFILLLIISAADSLVYLRNSFVSNGLSFNYSPIPFEEIKSIPQYAEENGWPIEQYMAPADASFFKYIARQPN